MNYILEVNDVIYSYSNRIDVLKNISIKFLPGMIYAIQGKSGSGKSTLLSLLAGLDNPNSGEILYKGCSIKKINRDNYRAKSVGVIFQSFNLLLHLTALQNVLLAMEISEVKISDKKSFAYNLLYKFGIDKETAERKILKLSGGEQQRVAIARALSHNPDVILADEPTGNLDNENEQAILEILRDLAIKDNKYVIIVTHDKSVVEYANYCLSISGGKIIC